MKYYALISTNDFYRVEFEVPDGMSNEAIEKYVYYNCGQWEQQPLCGGYETEIIELGPITPEVTP